MQGDRAPRMTGESGGRECVGGAARSGSGASIGFLEKCHLPGLRVAN